MQGNFWYTFSTDVLAYGDSTLKFLVGILSPSTTDKLKLSKSFFLMPKDAVRHKINLFKPSLHKYYEKSKEMITRHEDKEWEFEIRYCSKIIRRYDVSSGSKADMEFVKLISPLYSWTFEHVNEYIAGEKIAQTERRIGNASVILIDTYNIEPFRIKFKPIPRDSAQRRIFDIPDYLEKLDFSTPVHDRVEFMELLGLFDFIYEKTHE